jgi:S-adenosylmethionine:tRNA ribosyltransferase-isomerase
MRTADFNYHLPEELIAQAPAAARDQSRLLVLERSSGKLEHCRFFHLFLERLRAGDLLVLNDTMVLPARLRGRKEHGGGQIEILLLEEIAPNEWWSMLRPAKRVRPGARLSFRARNDAEPALEAEVLGKNSEGHCLLRFLCGDNIVHRLEEYGEVPLPPYIARSPQDVDRERYQTVYARSGGSVAAPTAGLHFTEELIEGIKRMGVDVRHLTLHVGAGTFAPVKAASLEEHVMHEERFFLSGETADAVNEAKSGGRRVIAVGTTTLRVLESVALSCGGKVAAGHGRTRLFVYPPFRFQVADGLLTNFHLPQSTLLMLVSAFAAPGGTEGRELVLGAYEEAVRERYRFFSYGDAMFIC